MIFSCDGNGAHTVNGLISDDDHVDWGERLLCANANFAIVVACQNGTKTRHCDFFGSFSFRSRIVMNWSPRQHTFAVSAHNHYIYIYIFHVCVCAKPIHRQKAKRRTRNSISRSARVDKREEIKRRECKQAPEREANTHTFNIQMTHHDHIIIVTASCTYTVHTYTIYNVPPDDWFDDELGVILIKTLLCLFSLYLRKIHKEIENLPW